MRVLIICSKRIYAPFTKYMAPFVYEQMEDLKKLGVDCDVYLISGGSKGYLKAIIDLRKKVKDYLPDVLHAHYGLCGLIANTQRKIPVVTTYHGSDLNSTPLRFFSLLTCWLSKANIVVSIGLMRRSFFRRKTHIIPCGVNTSLLTPMSKAQARINLRWQQEDIYILFSKEFFNKEKNYPLAKAAVDEYGRVYQSGRTVHLIEFIGFSREEVHWLYNAVDCVIMTSHHEGSPQLIKEAMLCNCPIVSVDVGDVKQVISGTEGCYIAERTASDLAEKLNLAIRFGRTKGRDSVIRHYDSTNVAQRVIALYKSILNEK